MSENPAKFSHQKAYLEDIKFLSDAIVKAQTPIRVLDAIKWPARVKEQFFAQQCREQPQVTREMYENNLSLDWALEREKFHIIERETTKKLGQFNTVGQIIRRTCDEYIKVLQMLEARGTPEFYWLSQVLYGSSQDVFHAGDPTLSQLGEMMSASLCQVDENPILVDDPRTITAQESIGILQNRLNLAFQDESAVRVILSDGIIADAAAGADYIKIRKDAMFNERDLKILEVHEGLVHIATSLNGNLQPICTFLGKGPPSSTMTQEGLAILMEVITRASYPARLKKISNRIRAVALAEEGATFVDVFNFYQNEGYDPDESYNQAMRVFRGSLPTMGPFTKDLSYCKGFVTIYNFIQLAVQKGKLDRIPLLFCGKTRIEDIRDIHQLVQEGLVILPKYIPKQFEDLNSIVAWMCFSNFLNQLSLEKIESDYAYLLSE